jgi:quinol monooxygenase YgiN
VTELLVIARHRMKAGEEDTVLAILPRLIEAARAEPGNLSFVAYRELGDEQSYVLLERYKSRDAFADHQHTEHFQKLVLEQIVPRLEDRILELIDVEDEST